MWVILASAFAAWLLFVAAQRVSAAQSDRYAMAEPEEYVERASAAPLLLFAAVAVFGLCALLAKRGLARPAGAGEPRSRLTAPVRAFATLSLIIALALGAWGAVMLFLSGFLEGYSYGSTATAPLVRVVNVYLPILFYTVLVVTLLLAGFVFAPSSRAPRGSAPQQAAAPRQVIDPQQARRATAFAYATPIVAAAVAFVLGLIVYDLTRTSLQVWIWVAIFALIAFGVHAGTRFARRGMRSAQQQSASDETGVEAGQDPAAVQPQQNAAVAGGADIMNFVLSILFAVFAVSMSLGYGSSAVYGLSVSPDLSLSIYSDQDGDYDDGTGSVKYTKPTVSLSGSDLERGSDATVTLEPGAVPVASGTVDGDRWLSVDKRLPDDLEPGDYELVATGTAVEGTALEVILPVTIEESGAALFPKGDYLSAGSEAARVLPMTARWALDELLPAALLLVLGMALIGVTLTARHRDE